MTSVDGPTVFIVDDDGGVRPSIECMLKSVGLKSKIIRYG
jgi:FixJ family two-component response regulator